MSRARGDAYAELVELTRAQIEDLRARVPTDQEYEARQSALADQERAAIQRLNLSEAQLVDQLALHKAALAQAIESKTRADELAAIFARLFAEVATRIEEGQRRGGAGQAKVNKTAAGHTYTEAKDRLRSIWASGGYASKNQCAEAEHARLGLALKTARKALIGAPKPILCAERGE